MTFAVCLAVTLVICLTCDKAIKKYPYLFYIGAALLSAAAYCINTFAEVRTLAPFVRDYLVPVLTNALFATSFWTVVMWTGALKNGSKLMKKLMPIRGELSITAALLTIGHIVIYGMTYLSRLFSGRGITGDFILFIIVAAVLVLIMTPLTVLSVKKIRKKMKGKTWKNIQRAAYVFYALTYLHIVLALWSKIQRGNTISTDNVLKYIDLVIYTAVFGAYAACRIRKYYLLRKKPESQRNTNLISSAGFAVCALAICLLAFPFAKLGNQKEIVAVNVSSQPSETVTETSQLSSSVAEISPQVSEIVSENTEVSVFSETEISETESVVSQDSEVESSQAEESAADSNHGESNVNESSAQASAAQQSSSAPSQISKQETSAVQVSQPAQQTSKETSVIQQSSSVSLQTSKQETSAVQPSQPVQQSSKETSVAQQSSSAPSQQSKAPVVQQSSTAPVQEPSKEPEPSVVAEEPSKNVLYHDGTYTGQAYGYDGDIYVTVTLSGDKITNITARSEESDEWYFETAEKSVISAIISRQNTNVDAVSGATFSSKGIMQAVQNALNSAKI